MHQTPGDGGENGGEEGEEEGGEEGEGEYGYSFAFGKR